MFYSETARNSRHFVIVLALSLFLVTACYDAAQLQIRMCEVDSDCDPGYICHNYSCVASADGDGEIDWETWQRECPEDPPETEMTAYCRKYSCEPVMPPECWECEFVADHESDGSACFDGDGNPGFCNDGKCQNGGPDGDGENDGDGNVCEQNGGACYDFVCPGGWLETDLALGCGGLCCVPPEHIECLTSGGFCDDYDVGHVPCGEEGYRMEEGLGCGLFGNICCLPDNPPECIREGQIGSVTDGLDCCPGLTRISNTQPIEGGVCNPMPSDSFICTYCGNDVCGRGENYCNCDQDCASPGNCTSDDECPPDRCYNEGTPMGISLCIELRSYCAAGDCRVDEDYFEAMVCNYASGHCEPPGATLCEQDGNGLCNGAEMSYCPEGYQWNRYPLGCDDNSIAASCCLDAGCLRRDGYCTTVASGCDNGFRQSENRMGCPGGNEGMCCIPIQQECRSDWECGEPGCEGDDYGVCYQHYPYCDDGICRAEEEIYYDSVCIDGKCLPQSEYSCQVYGGMCIGWGPECPEGTHWDPNLNCEYGQCCMPDSGQCLGYGEIGYYYEPIECCEGLEMVAIYDTSSSGECMEIPCDCYACINPYDGYCDSSAYENYCNSPDCEQIECYRNSDCGETECWDDPNGRCTMKYATCRDNRCEYGESSMADSYCDPEYGACQPYEETRCMQEGGYCSSYQAGCRDNYQGYSYPENLDCPGGRSALCCLYEPSMCTSTGEIGFYYEDDYCCESLSQTELVMVGDDGQCIYVDCDCFICIREYDGYCDESAGENICNSSDCQGTPPVCYSDYDCIDQPWMVDCEGHWDCIDYTCQPRCGWPCGDGYCDAYSGESVQNCYSDCGQEYCYSDSDCPDSCEDYDGGFTCLQNKSYCDADMRMCFAGESYEVPGALCNYDTGLCEPMGISECELDDGVCVDYWGCPAGYTPSSQDCFHGHCCMPENYMACETEMEGYCSTWQQGCYDGYMEAGGTFGCENVYGRSALCCIPHEPECYYDYDCGPSYCYMEPEGYCVEESGRCYDGYCEYGTSATPSAWCDERTGRCVPYAQYCTDQGGICTGSFQACPDNYYRADYPCPPDVACAGGCVCCMPDEPQPDCYEDWQCGEAECYDIEDGSCGMWIPYCMEGYCSGFEEYYENSSCNYDIGKCVENGSPWDRCYENGGYCDYWWRSCENGYVDTQEKGDCQTLTRCCLP